MSKSKIAANAQLGIIRDGESGGNKQYLYLSVASDAGEEGVAGAIILSNKENGIWKRSTATLQWTSAGDYTEFVAKNAIKAWKVGSKTFLNNAAV